MDDLVGLFMADDDYASGAKKPPRSVTSAEAQEVVHDLYGTLEEAGAQMTKLAEDLGKTVACHNGCWGCCEPLILISTVEADAVAAELDRADRTELRKRFIERARDWVRARGDNAMRAADALAAGYVTAYVTRMKRHEIRNTLCPLNTGGSCEAYVSRPLPCRKLLVLDTSEYCRASPHPGRPDATPLSSEGWENMFAACRNTTAGLQAAMGKGVRRDPLPIALLRALGEPDQH